MDELHVETLAVADIRARVAAENDNAVALGDECRRIGLEPLKIRSMPCKDA